jgi:hypothetical protein
LPVPRTQAGAGRRAVAVVFPERLIMVVALVAVLAVALAMAATWAGWILAT